MNSIFRVFWFCVWWISPVYSVKKLHVGLGEPNSPENRNIFDVEDKWFEQNLNHFDPTDGRTWKQVLNY